MMRGQDDFTLLAWAVAATFLLVCLVAAVIFAWGMYLQISENAARRRAKRARIAKSEDRYREHLAARNARPAVTIRVHLDGREIARRIGRAQ